MNQLPGDASSQCNPLQLANATRSRLTLVGTGRRGCELAPPPGTWVCSGPFAAGALGYLFGAGAFGTAGAFGGGVFSSVGGPCRTGGGSCDRFSCSADGSCRCSCAAGGACCTGGGAGAFCCDCRASGIDRWRD